MAAEAGDASGSDTGGIGGGGIGGGDNGGDGNGWGGLDNYGFSSESGLTAVTDASGDPVGTGSGGTLGAAAEGYGSGGALGVPGSLSYYSAPTPGHGIAGLPSIPGDMVYNTIKASLPPGVSEEAIQNTIAELGAYDTLSLGAQLGVYTQEQFDQYADQMLAYDQSSKQNANLFDKAGKMNSIMGFFGGPSVPNPSKIPGAVASAFAGGGLPGMAAALAANTLAAELTSGLYDAPGYSQGLDMAGNPGGYGTTGGGSDTGWTPPTSRVTPTPAANSGYLTPPGTGSAPGAATHPYLTPTGGGTPSGNHPYLRSGGPPQDTVGATQWPDPATGTQPGAQPPGGVTKQGNLSAEDQAAIAQLKEWAAMTGDPSYHTQINAIIRNRSGFLR